MKLLTQVYNCNCVFFLQSKYWARIRRLVAGRLVNGYSTNDMILSMVYRYEECLRFNTRSLAHISWKYLVLQV